MSDSDGRTKAAAQIRAIAKQFEIASDAVVTFQENGRPPIRLRLSELLKQLDARPEGQLGLF